MPTNYILSGIWPIFHNKLPFPRPNKVKINSFDEFEDHIMKIISVKFGGI